MQTVLLDTCVLLIAAEDDNRLGDQARSVLTDGDADIFISPATYWEIAIKIKIGKLELNVEYDDFIEEAIKIYDLHILRVELKHTSLLTTLELHHRDPFDRLLIAQSICEDMPIVSSDTTFDKYEVTRMWNTPRSEDDDGEEEE